MAVERFEEKAIGGTWTRRGIAIDEEHRDTA
jgi:hypothetical protein